MLTVIRNGLVYDGSANEPAERDILVSGQRIVRIGAVPKNAAHPEKPMMRKVAISEARDATDEYMVLSAPASAPIAIMIPSTQAIAVNWPVDCDAWLA